jgi:hypothetical protein
MRSTIEMAREVGIEFQRNIGPLGRESISTAGSQSLEKIERLIAMARADEREACAKVCDDLSLSQNSEWEVGTLDCAEAIRARGETK